MKLEITAHEMNTALSYYLTEVQFKKPVKVTDVSPAKDNYGSTNGFIVTLEEPKNETL